MPHTTKVFTEFFVRTDYVFMSSEYEVKDLYVDRVWTSIV